MAPTTTHDALPLRTVSRLTGLTPDIIRAWEKRYGVVAPRRGPRGARLYTSADVAHLRLLQTVVRSGRAIGDVAKLSAAELMRLTDTPATRSRPAADAGDVLRDTLAALERFDGVAIDRHLSDALMALGAQNFCRRVAAPLLQEVGQRWADGRLSIVDEHLLSATVRNLLAGMMRVRGSGGGKVIVLAALSGERHELGLLLAALTIAEAGFAPCYLGTDLPADEILSAARRTQATVVGLGIVNGENQIAAFEQVRRIERRLPAATELWLGGGNAAALAGRLKKTRAIVLHDVRTLDTELDRARLSLTDA